MSIERVNHVPVRFQRTTGKVNHSITELTISTSNKSQLRRVNVTITDPKHYLFGEEVFATQTVLTSKGETPRVPHELLEQGAEVFLKFEQGDDKEGNKSEYANSYIVNAPSFSNAASAHADKMAAFLAAEGVNATTAAVNDKVPA